MAVPRPVLIALLGLALCAAAFMVKRGAREPGGEAVTATPAQITHKAAPVTHKAAKPATKASTPKAVKPQVKQPAAVKPALGRAEVIALEVRAALKEHKAVVFFFTRAGAADDTGAREAIKAIQGNRRVLVVRAGLNDLSTFRPVLSGAGVSQVPAVVVAHAGKPARLIQGFVDSGTLRQTVADSLR
jgi:hypothetical protein